MEDILVPIAICGMLFIGLPWIIFHYVAKLKQSRSLSMEDENLMDELYDLARRLSDRVETVERLVAADNPGFRPGASRPTETYAALADERRIEREDDLLGRREPSREPRSRFERR
jgi:phage shock protein B